MPRFGAYKSVTPAGAGGSIGSGSDAYGGYVRSLVGQAGRLGYYNPAGSSYYKELLRRRARRTYGNRLRSSGALGRILGLDPAQQRSNILAGEQQAGSDVSNLLGEASLASERGNIDYFRSLLGGERSFEQQKQLAEIQRQYEEEQRRRGFLGGIGSAAGSIATSYIPRGKYGA